MIPPGCTNVDTQSAVLCSCSCSRSWRNVFRRRASGFVVYAPGVLSTKLLLAAYCQGIFPMAVIEQGELAWFSPDPRAIIPLDDRFHVPHGLKRTLKKQPFKVTFDTAFGRVIRGCAKAHGSTWI